MDYRFELANGDFTEWKPLVEGDPYEQPETAKNIWLYRKPWQVAMVQAIEPEASA